MVDLKKFVAYFLVLASIASSAAFALSGFLDGQTPDIANNITPKLAETAPPVSKNAFVEKVPDNSPIVDIEPGLPPVILTDNLTRNVAQNLTREFFRANADGPFDLDGEKVVSLPSESQIDSAIVKKLASKETVDLVSFPDFGEGVPKSELVISSNNSPEELGRYLVALDALFKNTISSKDFSGLTKGTPSFEAVSAAQLVYARALYNLKSLAVPSSFSALHESALKLVLDAKKIIDIPTQNTDDPLKTLAVMKQVSGKIESVLKNDFDAFSMEFKKLEAQNISVLPPAEGKNPIGQIFVREAHAIIGVPISTLVDVNSISTNVSTYGSWIRKIWEWVQKALLQQLIHSLILMIQQQVVGWINGEGDPQFVTNWQDLIGFTYDEASSSTINTIARLLCDGLDLNLRVGFLPPPVYNSRFGCSISQILNRADGSLDRFRNGFGEGGFQAYGAVLQENFFILSMETSDAALNDALAAQGAQVKDATVGGGFLSTKKCANNRAPNKQTGRCADGSQPILTTPGQTIGNTVSNALDLGPKSVVAAQDISGLIGAVVDAAINRVVLAGLNGLLGVYADRRPAGSTPLRDSCAGLAPGSPASDNCLASVRQAVTINASPDQNLLAGTTPGNAVLIPQFNVTSSPQNQPPPVVITPVQCWPKTRTWWLDPRNGSVVISIQALGGDGTYDWFTPLGNPPRLAGFGATNFSPSFSIAQASTMQDITVTSAGVTDTCQITITTDQTQVTPPPGPLPTLTTLAVIKSGGGDGTITGALQAGGSAGIDCGADCQETYTTQPSVILTATPAIGSTFTGWSGGGCAGTNTCTVAMTQANGNQTITATFTAIISLTVSKAGTGAGTVTSAPAGINCGTDCNQTYPSGGAAPSVTLTATATAGSVFAGWSGACTGTVRTCTLSMSQARATTATFNTTAGNTLACAPATQTIAAGGNATVTMTSLVNRSYTIVAVGGVPVPPTPVTLRFIGSGSRAILSYAASSTTPYLVVVTNADGSVTCRVTVN